MTAAWTNWPRGILDALRGGTVIPAHLLALDSIANSMCAGNAR